MFRSGFSLLLICFLCLSPELVLGQSVDDNWVFGRYNWIKFSGSSVTSQGAGPFTVDEGSSCISSSSGDLLFSCSGSNVFDRNGNAMPNGHLLNGHFSSTQNSVIVPFPGDLKERYYYVFTVAAQNNWPSTTNTGLEYAVVDMQANGGLGDVIAAPIELYPNSAEKVHATYHRNEKDVWVLSHELESDLFYAHRINCDGIQAPVISKTGRVHPYGYFGNGGVGAMKISHDGSLVASTYQDTESSGIPTATYLELGFFDNESGKVNIHSEVEKLTDGNSLLKGYGLEFSPDNSKLYWTMAKTGPGFLYQYDLSNSNWQSTESLVIQASVKTMMGMSLGPNGKIYIARSNGSNFISAIENPNADAADVIITDQAVQISGFANLGLPNTWMFPYEVSNKPKIEYYFEQICYDQTLSLNVPAHLLEDFIWNTGEENPVIDITSPGIYFVTQNNCPKDTSFFIVEDDLACKCEFHVPNAFTPNDDDKNDEFGVVSNCKLQNYTFEVFNSWGQKVFISDSQEKMWDGRVASEDSPVGVYIWMASWDVNGKRKEQKGTFQLLY